VFSLAFSQGKTLTDIKPITLHNVLARQKPLKHVSPVWVNAAHDDTHTNEHSQNYRPNKVLESLHRPPSQRITYE
jgi:hypothetical protein